MSKRTLTAQWLVSLLVVLWSLPAMAQRTGATIRGQVTDSASSRPLAGAEIYVVTAAPIARGSRTDASGRYSISAVAAGEVTLRARLVGYAPQERRITVGDGQAAVADFRLSQRYTQLDEVVVTGTGGSTQRRTVGNAIETISAKDVLQIAPARSVEQLIGARTPGRHRTARHRPGGHRRADPRRAARAACRSATIRSSTSTACAWMPTPSRGPAQRGGAGASRLNDINPEDIESIEIIKGPAASTLYGTEASNGVIQIITKRGEDRRARLDFTTRQGTNWLANPEGRAGTLYGRATPTSEIVSFNLYQNELASGRGPIFTNGRNQGYSVGLTAAPTINRYCCRSTYDDDVGVVRCNWDKKFSARANIDVIATNQLQFQGSVGHIRDRMRLAQKGDQHRSVQQSRVGHAALDEHQQARLRDRSARGVVDVESHANNDRTTLSVTGELLATRVVHASPGGRPRRELARTTGCCTRKPHQARCSPPPRMRWDSRVTSERLGNSSPSTTRQSLKYALNDKIAFTTSVRPPGVSLGGQCAHGDGDDLPSRPDHDGDRRRRIATVSRTSSPTRPSACSCSSSWPGTTGSSSPPRCAPMTTARSARSSRRRTTRRSARRG